MKQWMLFAWKEASSINIEPMSGKMGWYTGKLYPAGAGKRDAFYEIAPTCERLIPLSSGMRKALSQRSSCLARKEEGKSKMTSCEVSSYGGGRS
ncbi:hypothetical protein [Paenibacillus selenitireducens]|uniref:hypothetical protein n=1 Tax=Paenibacillus selenitireducens TaxID=1324314 RepID=UPI00117E2486|nr:hypothetical protein [Paenibacillus selenitireducens]